MRLRSGLCRTIVAAAVILTSIAPEMALAQQPAAPSGSPAQIDNRADHQERQPTRDEVCAGAGADSVDCSRRTAQELKDIQRQIDKAEQEHVEEGATAAPGK